MANESDKISQLPGHITDQILSCLPIKDAVRTSILSRKWRYKWSYLPQLVFDDRCTRDEENLVKIVDKVLLHHTGPLQKFELSHKAFWATSNIDHWIRHLSNVSVKEIVLDIWNGQKYKVPTSLFNCRHLIHLELFNCAVKIPPTFEGFKNLESLDLQHVELSQDGLEALTSCFPKLKRFKLRNLEGFKQINIEAGNLEWLHIGGAFQDVSFGIMNHLKSVAIALYDDIANICGPSNANWSNLHKFFQHLHKIQSLEIVDYSLKYLAVGNVPQTLPNALVHLKYIFICIDFNSVEEILTVMCLIRSSPQLKQVDFQARTRERSAVGIAANFWEDHQPSCFQLVRVVSLNDISGGPRELGFIKFLLSHSPGLQQMTITPKSTSGDGKLLGELLQFWRASTQAELIFLEPVDMEVDSP